MGLFGQDTKPDPKEQVRELQRKLRSEMRVLDRQTASIQREEAKVKRQIKDAAKKGDRDVCRLLAKSIVQSRRAVNRLQTSKAQINSVSMGMQQQLATVRMAGSLQRSTEVLRSMQSLMRVPEVAATMRDLSREMMKAGIIDEMIEETMESMEPDDLEEETQHEVDRVLWEVTEGAIGEAPMAPTEAIAGTSTLVADDVDEPAEAVLRDRLDALRS